MGKKPPLASDETVESSARLFVGVVTVLESYQDYIRRVEARMRELMKPAKIDDE